MALVHRFAGIFAVVVVVLLATAGGRSQTASAYGNAGDAHQIFQIAISANCNNPDLCGNEIGGFWGWAVLYDDGTGEAELTGCGHLANSHGSGLQGAGHEHVDFNWTIVDGMIVVTSETDVAVGHGQPTTITIPSESELIAPAAPGHYSTDQILGFSGPGVSFQIQVVALH